MKYNNIISCLILLLIAGVFAACSSDDQKSIIDDNRQVAFVVTEQQPLLRSMTGEVDVKTTFTEGDAIGVFAIKRKDATIVEAPKSSGNYAENVKYVRQADGKWLADGSPIYYPMDDAILDYYAYFPYSEKVTDPTKIEFNVTNQSTDTDYSKNDLMTARNTAKPAIGSPVVLQFSHKFALVQVQMVSSTINLADLERVGLTNCLSSATLDFSQTTESEVKTKDGEKKAITMTRVEANSSASTYTFRAVVPAQMLQKGTKTLDFSHKTEGDFSYTIDEDVALKGGNIKLFKISIEASTSAKTKRILMSIK